MPQIANLFASLPQQETVRLTSLLDEERAEGVRGLLSDREATARELISSDFITRPKRARVGEVLAEIRSAGYEPRSVSYIYVVEGEEEVLAGVVDLRDLVLSPDEATLGDIMISPVVAADESTLREDLTELFAKYQYRMIPVVDEHDRIFGVIRDNDVMKAPELRT